jgi:hypothetical protein
MVFIVFPLRVHGGETEKFATAWVREKEEKKKIARAKHGKSASSIVQYSCDLCL